MTPAAAAAAVRAAASPSVAPTGGRVGAGLAAPWQAYAVALAASAATFGVHRALDARLGEQATLLLFTAPIVLSAYVGGLRGGLLATGLTCYLLPPLHHGFSAASAIGHWPLAAAALAGMAISVSMEGLHRARRRADSAGSEHAQATRARLSERRLRDLIDGLGPSMFVGLMTPEGILVEANRPALAAAGLKPEDVLGKPFEDARWWSFSQPVQRQLREAIARAARGEASRYDTQVCVAGDEIIDVDFSLQPLLDDHGKVTFLVPSATVITERKRTENALRESDEKFHLLADHITDVFWIRSPDMRELHYLSPAFERIWGRSVASLHANPGQWTEFVLPEDRDRVRSAFGTLGENAPSLDIEYRILRPGGEMRWIRARAFQVRDATDNPIRHIGIVTDITDRKRTETALQESEGRYRALVDWSPESLAVSRRGTILFVNPAAVRMLGATCAQDLVGKPLLERVHPDFRQIVLDRVKQNADLGGLLPLIEEKLLRLDGTVIDVEVQGTSIMYGEEPATFSSMRDVTEKKALEAQFLRAQRMEGIGTLAAGIAHDLNNVLAPILMSIEMLKEHAADEGSLSLLATLHSSAQRGADLVRQVLSFARGVDGLRVAVNPLSLMSDLVKVMRDTFPKSIEVRLAPARDLWTVTGDPTQMHQVFLNLCVNARDAMPEGGRLTVSLENVVLDATDTRTNPDSRPGTYMRVTVEDTGSGIPAEIRDRVFEPFFTTQEFGKGTGLGLSTALAIVKSHGGFVDLRSAAGAGATFSVYLPADPSVSVTDQVAAKDTELPRGNGELILVVDDEEAIRKVAQRTLERFGYRVTTASDGAEALALYVRHQDEIAVVLTDMAMPVMDGPALIAGLRGMNPRVRVIASSGLTSAVEVGVPHFIAKPYTASAVLKAVRKALS